MIEEDKLKKILLKVKEEKDEVAIHYDDKRQIYTIRIPVHFARAVNLKKGSKFRFILSGKFSEQEGKLKTELKGELV